MVPTRDASNEAALLDAARGGDERAFESLVRPYQRELRAFAYRMAGSLSDADDLVQESLLRAWRGLANFEGRASLRTWLYRVAWTACVDTLEKRGARSLEMDLGPPARAEDPMPAPCEDRWIGPCPPAIYEGEDESPEARYGRRQSVSLAFLAALQLLPARQRAILLLRDVLGLSAEECAELLETSIASINSGLQRARTTLDERAARFRLAPRVEPETRSLLARYVQAWESADVSQLVSLLREDARLSMPPYPMWLLGRDSIGTSIGQMVLTPDAKGRYRLIETEANGLPAVAAYRANAAGDFDFSSLQLLIIEDGAIAAIDAFLDPRLAASFDLPARLP